MRELYKAYAAKERENYIQLLKELASIPSPSYHELEIAEYILDYLKNEAEKTGYKKVRLYMDDVYNVYCELGELVRDGEYNAVFTAHTDTVFPDCYGPLKVREKNGNIYGLGIMDNRANICALMYCIKYMMEQGIEPKKQILIVFNGCEEGLGNLRGSSRIIERYPRICKWIAFDLDYGILYNRALGSCRYKVEINTPGGHSYENFGEENAIERMACLIQEFYNIHVEEREGTLTYNVGMIEGGTTVNAVANSCTAYFEWRSDLEENLEWMENQFTTLLSKIREKENVEVVRKVIGIRPSTGTFSEEGKAVQEDLVKRTDRRVREIIGRAPVCKAGSTDCNIPLSKGIPAVCIGTCQGYGQHTREEYVRKDSLEQGFVLALETVLEECER